MVNAPSRLSEKTSSDHTQSAQTKDNAMRMQKGFTLIELMIVVVIIAILSAYAVPAYNEYVKRGKLVEGTSVLSQERARMEMFFSDALPHTYVGAAAHAATTNFTYGFDAQTAATFIVTATGTGSIAGFKYTIDEAGNRTSSTPYGNSPTCWVVKNGGGC